MVDKKDIKLIELSKRELEEIMIENKYLKAIDTFGFNIEKDIRLIIRRLNRKKRYLEELYRTLIILDKDVDKYSMQAKQTIFRCVFEDDSIKDSNYTNRNMDTVIKCKKILTAYYKYLDYGAITPIEDIYNKALSILFKHKQIEKAYEIHNNLVLDSNMLDEYNLNISKEYFKSLRLYLTSKIGRYEFESIQYKITQKIKINTAIKNKVDFKILDEMEHSTLLDYVIVNRSYITELYKIYNTMIDRIGVKFALKYMDKFILPFIKSSTNIDHIGIYSDFKGMDVLDFIKKSYGLCDKSYTIKVYDPSDINRDLYDIAKNFGTSMIPQEVWDYIKNYIDLFEEYADALDEGEYPDELAEEESDIKDELMRDLNYISRDGVYVVKTNAYDSPFLQKNYFANISKIKDLSIAGDMEGYAYDIGLICVHSEKIDSFIKNNIKNYDKINELLVNLEKLFTIYCEYSFTMSEPKIITKESSLFPDDISSEYLIVSTTIYNSMMDKTLYKGHLSNKSIDVADHSTIETVLDINEKIKAILL